MQRARGLSCVVSALFTAAIVVFAFTSVADGQINPSDDICGRTPYCSTPVRQVDRLVTMIFGVCGAIYDEVWRASGLPVDTPLRQPTAEELPHMHQVNISIELKCARNNDRDPAENVRFDRENPKEYSERICRSYRQELYARILDNLPPVYLPANYPPELQDDALRLEAERKEELVRRGKIFMESYTAFGPSFYECVGGIDFMKVKLCPDVIPEATRGSEPHRDRIDRCLDQAASAIRATLDSAALAGGQLDSDGMPVVDWYDPNTAWGQYEQDSWWGGSGGQGRQYDHLTFEDTVRRLKTVPPECRSARPATDGTTDLRQQQEDFNNRVQARAERMKEQYQLLVKSAADNWLAQRNADPTQPPPPNITRGSPDAVDLMVRIPCNDYCEGGGR